MKCSIQKLKKTARRPRDFQMVGKTKDYDKANHKYALMNVLCLGALLYRLNREHRTLCGFPFGNPASSLKPTHRFLVSVPHTHLFSQGTQGDS